MNLPEEAKRLLPYATDTYDREMLQHFILYGTVKATADNTHMAKRTMQRRMARLRQHAARHGMHPSDPQGDMLTNHPESGRSTLIKHDPPLEDGSVLTWVKTKAEHIALKEHLEGLIHGAQISPADPAPFPATEHTSGDILPILTIADAHLGLLAAEGETGFEWNLEKGEQCLYDAIDYLVARMPMVDKALLVNLGDMTHSDALTAKTPRSNNALDVSHRIFDCSRAAGRVMRYAIERMLLKAKFVEVKNIRGNHDEHSAWGLNEILMAVYEGEPRVLIENNDAPTQVVSWKDNLIPMTHGEAVKYQTFYNTITSQYPQQFGKAKYVYAMQGHTHHPVTDNIGNVFFETHSTLTRSDAYHVLKQYQSLRRMLLVNLEAAGGEHSRVVYNPRIK